MTVRSAFGAARAPCASESEVDFLAQAGTPDEAYRMFSLVYPLGTSIVVWRIGQWRQTRRVYCVLDDPTPRQSVVKGV